ncbi:aspartyl-phosphate phosphatase Spo0E family protein [Paenibacillus tuaregi]|uniref:aspartyl-phosphate phosphatase Spo0E family protein n=1 Tax=Paenibacillus tuaregi TaxID=1816681 RepID=UPI000837B7EA|nr:aspartyl-phosphate phosphatase Spo0E family protein [Paenibacillus tuaregi]
MASKAYQPHEQHNKGSGRVNEELLALIENLRYELAAMAGDRDFTSANVLELSQRLDKYIVMAQHQMIRGYAVE